MPTGILRGSRRARTSTWAMAGAEDRHALIAEDHRRVVVPVQFETADRAVVSFVDDLPAERAALRAFEGRVPGIDEQDPATGAFSLVSGRVDDGGEPRVRQDAVEAAFLRDPRTGGFGRARSRTDHVAEPELLEDDGLCGARETLGDRVPPGVPPIAHAAVRRGQSPARLLTSTRSALGPVPREAPLPWPRRRSRCVPRRTRCGSSSCATAPLAATHTAGSSARL